MTILFHIKSALKSVLFMISAFMLWLFSITNSLYSSEIDSLFQSDEIIKLELRTDFSAIQKDRNGNPEYHDGELIYYSPDGEAVKFFVKVMARGNFRRDPAICKFPPLSLNFKKKEVENTIFDNQNKLKLVTPCHWEEDVIEEYTVYKLYNQVTNLSMKVRLAKILYFDTGSGKKLFEKHSFFIEDKDHVALRNNASAKDQFLTPFDLNSENIKRLAVFQYLIGNKDWHITSRRNIEIMQPDDSSMEPFAIPYDFDFAALINADYTKPVGVPDSYLSTRRIYKGICFTEDEFKDTFEFYRKLRPVFESIINSQKLISKDTRREMIGYIDHFYKVIGNSELLKHEFLSSCQTRKDFNLADVSNPDPR